MADDPGADVGRSPVGPPARLALAAAVVALMGILSALRLGAVEGPLELVLQAVLVVLFCVLLVIDLRAATAIVVLELVCGGASGRWTAFPGNVSGRLVLDALLFLRAVAELAILARRGTPPLRHGRYTLHGVILAALLAGGWMALGLVNGNTPSAVFGDGNGMLFLAFVLVLAALAQSGDLGWLRRWLLVACAVNAVLFCLLVLATLTGVVRLGPDLNELLVGRLDMGGVVGVMSDGTRRLYLGSGLFLQVGVALAVWELVRDARRPWPWALLLLLAADLLATWTRGYWLGAALAAGLVVAVGAASLRRSVAALAAGAGVVVVAGVIASAAGSALPTEIVDRAVSTITFAEDSVGGRSNAVRAEQARVLVGHIAERPVTGWGFGTVAPDYPFGAIWSYELAYLDLGYKTGLVGLLLWATFPLRLLVDSVRGRLGRLRLAPGVGIRETAVPIAILVPLLMVGATNPYLFAAFGMTPMLLSIAWLDPYGRTDDRA